MRKKGFFPYDWFDSIDKLKMPIEELKQEYFDNKLTLSVVVNDEWLEVLNIIEKLNIKTFE